MIDKSMFDQLTSMMLEIKAEQVQQRNLLESSNREKEELQEQVDILNEFKDEVNDYEQFVRLLEIARDEVNSDDYIDGVYCRQYVNLNNIPLDPSTWCTLSRRAASYHRLTKGRSPERRGCHNIYRGKDVAFIVATINLIVRGL